MCCSFLLHANGSSFQAFLGDPSPKETARGVATNRRFRGFPGLIISLLPSDYSDPSASPVSGFPDFLSCFIFVSLPPSLCLLWRLPHGFCVMQSQCFSQVCVLCCGGHLGRGRRRRGGFAFGQAFPLPPLRRRTSPWPHAHNCFIHTKLPSHLCSEEVSNFYYF